MKIRDAFAQKMIHNKYLKRDEFVVVDAERKQKR
jgi:hypothetical protein